MHVDRVFVLVVSASVALAACSVGMSAAPLPTTTMVDGCTVIAHDEVIGGAKHLDPSTAPPPDAVYEDFPARPAWSGDHFSRTAVLVGATSPPPTIDERALVHNMEHGAVVVAISADHPEVEAIAAWASDLQEAGFWVPNAGATVFVVDWPTDRPEHVLLRAWGQAVDCSEWDSMTAEAFVFDHYGTHGIAPEGNFAPFPDGAMSEPVVPVEA